VDDYMNNWSYVWTTEKFMDKLTMMRDLMATYEEVGELRDLQPEDNPFYERPEPILIGEGLYRLEGLAYLMDNPVDVNLTTTPTTW
jgi:hypothetical protein